MSTFFECSFLLFIYIFNVIPFLNFPFMLFIRLSVIWSVRWIIGIPSFLLNIHLSLSTYSVFFCLFFVCFFLFVCFVTVFPNSRWSFLVQSIFLQMFWRHWFNTSAVLHCLNYYIFCIHSSVEGHLGCFQLLAIINKAAVNTVGHVSLLYV